MRDFTVPAEAGLRDGGSGDRGLRERIVELTW